jgi:hypothetical protein
MAGGSLINRLYDFLDGQVLFEYHLDNEFNRIHEWINGKLGNANIAADADIDGSKLKTGSVDLSKLTDPVYTAQTVDTKMAAAVLGEMPVRSVTGEYLVLGTVTPAELSFDPVTQEELGAYTKKVQVSHSYLISGDIAVASGDTQYLNPFFVSVAPGTTVKLAKVRFRINSGTSVGLKIQVNGVDATGFNDISVTTTAGMVDAADVTLMDGDLLAPVVTSVTGTPKNMTLTIVLEYTI